MELKIDFKMYEGVTLLKNTFIQKYILTAPPIFVVIYIYMLSISSESKNVSCSQIASSINNVSEGDVISAIAYWSEHNVLQLSGDVLTFLDIDNNIVTLQSNSYYDPTFIEKNSNDDIKKLNYLTEQCIGTLLKPDDVSTIFYLYDELQLPVDVIEFLLTTFKNKFDQSDSKNKKFINMHYIENTAIEWSKQNIKTVPKAIEYIKLNDKNYYTIRKHLGVPNEITPVERSYYDKWLTLWSFDMDIILEACYQTTSLNKANVLAYTDGILKKWNSANLKTIDEVIKYETENYSVNKDNYTKNKIPTKPKTVKKNKFANFSQKSLDFEKLEKLEQQLIKKQLGDE